MNNITHIKLDTTKSHFHIAAARERFLMGSGSLSGGGLLGQLGSSVGINSNNIGNAFIGVLIVIVLAIIVSAVYTQHRTKSKLTRAKLSSSQKSSSLSSIPTQSISALADGLELHNSRYVNVIEFIKYFSKIKWQSNISELDLMNSFSLSKLVWGTTNISI